MNSSISMDGRNDPLYKTACLLVRAHKRACIATVQRRLSIGWNRAHALVEAMVGDVIAEMPPTTKLLPPARGIEARSAETEPSAANHGALLPPIDHDDQMQRSYIPLPGGWELQTKGNGSTLRLLNKNTDERHPIVGPDHIIEFIERMALDVHEAARGMEAQKGGEQ